MKKLTLLMVLVSALFAIPALAANLNPVLTNANCQQLAFDINSLSNYRLNISATYEYGQFRGSNDGRMYGCRLSGWADFRYSVNYGYSIWANPILTNADCNGIVRVIDLLSTGRMNFSASCEHGRFVGSNDGRIYNSRISTRVTSYY